MTFRIAAETPQIKKKIRLTAEGRSYLEGLWDSGLTHPTSSRRVSILQEIHSYKGCEDYSEQSLTGWFTYRREKQKKKQVELQTALGPAHAFLYPSITYDELLKLGALYDQHIRNTGIPPKEDLVSVWSRAIKADPEHVRNWVDEKNAKLASPTRSEASPSSHVERQSSAHRSNERSLPTPSQSTSPEPIAGPSVVKAEPLRSPIIGRFPISNPLQQAHEDGGEKQGRRVSIVSTYPPSPVSSGFFEDKFPTYVHQSVETTSAQVQPARSDVPNTADLKQETNDEAPSPPSIAKQVASLLSKVPNQTIHDPARPSSTPQMSDSDFSLSFLPHEVKIREMLNKISSGKLRSAGLDPSLVSEMNRPPFPFPLPDKSNPSSSKSQS